MTRNIQRILIEGKVPIWKKSTIEYFKRLAGRYNIPCQTLINLYLVDCADHKKELVISWK